jgi:CheY-like chemotaxis protein
MRLLRIPRYSSDGGNVPELPSILVVEDEYLLAIDLEETLTQAGFAADIASSGEEALALFMNGTSTYRALVTDVRLRGSINGWEVAKRIREKEPAFPVVYVTGSSFEEWATERVPNSLLVPKGHTRAQLVTAVASLLGAPPIA